MCDEFAREGVWLDGPAAYAIPLIWDCHLFVLFSTKMESTALFHGLPQHDRPDARVLIIANWSLKHFAPMKAAPGFTTSLRAVTDGDVVCFFPSVNGL
jgi:hypothetical protein